MSLSFGQKIINGLNHIRLTPKLHHWDSTDFDNAHLPLIPMESISSYDVGD